MSLYLSTVSIYRKIGTTMDATGHPIDENEDLFVSIPASVQGNRTTTGAHGNDQHSRGTLEQPSTVRIYTPTNVTEVRQDDVVVHEQTGESFKVLRSINQGDRSRRWRIEASIL